VTVLNITTRAGLIDLMVDTLNKLGSTVVKERCENWIQLHEARANRVLRERLMVQEAKAVLTNGRIKLPPDWREVQSFQLNGGNGARPRVLKQCTAEQADVVRAEGRLTLPTYFCIVGQNLEIVPYTAEGLEIEMAYYRKVPALTTADPTNWLLTEHPDYYFYGSLVHSAPYLRDDERITTWGQLAQAAQDEMIAAGERARFSGSRLKTRARLRNR
jgi:hypothetical protein